MVEILGIDRWTW